MKTAQTFKIEKNVPLVKINRGGRGISKYDPLLNMKIGESCFMGNLSKTAKASLWSQLSRLKKIRGLKVHLTLRKVEGGYRVWRIV